MFCSLITECKIDFKVCFREGIAGVSWDFKNINLWESVLDLDQATPHVEDSSTDPAIAFGKKVEEAPPEEQPVSKAKKGEIIVKDIRGDIASYHWFLGLSWVPKLDIPVDNYVTRFVSCFQFVDRCMFLLSSIEWYSFSREENTHLSISST